MIGSTISHYRVVEKIGEGGMGVVYKAEDTRLGRTVAIKLLSPLVLDKKHYRMRLESEGQAVASLDHANTCTVHDMGEHDGQPYIVMGFIEGQTLQEKLDAGPVAIDEALDYAIQMARGLDEAHRKGVLHRDVKPGNVMITSQGQVKLMDFGLARLVDQTQITKTGMVVGTPAYMSPEQASGKPVDHRTDVWALGAVLYQMLTGKLPFRGDQPAALIHAIQTQDPVAPRKIRSEIPEDLERICLRALSKKPASRYDSMADALEELTTYRDRSRITITGEMAVREVGRRLRRPRVLVPIVAVVVLIAGAVAWFLYQQSRVQWARDVALPEIQRLIEEQELHRAFVLAREAESLVAGHQDLEAAWPEISTQISLRTTPSGADVSIRDYAGDADSWISLGATPLEDVRGPRGILVWRIEKAGYETLEVAGFETPMGIIGADGGVILQRKGVDPPEMIRIPTLSLVNWPRGSHPLNEYLIDRYEVTNRQFKQFIEAGGYRNRDYWTQPIVVDGEEIEWDHAISMFVDTSGRPGPAGWELGEYPEGEADFPVAGVSWYEAAAYAEWAGKSLPTMWHWGAAAFGPDLKDAYALFTPIVQNSNMQGVEEGPTAVGTHPGVSVSGAYDMGGNVKEWCWNALGGSRISFGGSWGDPAYWLINRDPQNPLTRDPTIGFRCVRYLSDDDPSEFAKPLTVLPPPDVSKIEIASDEAFAVYRRLYEYDPVEPEPVVEATDDSNPHHLRERVRFNAAASPDGMLVYVYLPKTGTPPFQTVVAFPGSHVLFNSSIGDVSAAMTPLIEVFTRSSRAYVLPIFQGTLERGGGALGMRDSRASDRDRTILWTREYRSTLDYLATRDDIDSDRAAFRGLSMGAGMAPFILAVEDRIKAAILIGAGLAMDPNAEKYPEANEFNFLPRIEVPVLMIAGSEDKISPVEEAQRPLFELIGTPPEHKRLAVLSGGHIPPVEGEFIREQLDWLDRYLGPVE